MSEATKPAVDRHAAWSVLRWIDGRAGLEQLKSSPRPDAVDWLRVMPFLALHVACVAVIWVGWSPVAVAVAVGLYAVRMFAITGFYHRYFSHRTFKTSRPWQFIFAVLGNAAAQRGPLWWASHHRRHHRVADRPEDTHSPVHHGFWWSHLLWLTTPRNFATDESCVQDWSRFAELRFLDRFANLVPLALAVGTFALGQALHHWAPSLGTDGWQMFIWGFVVSTVVLYHATFTINSLDHMVGRRRFDTPDNSRNNWVLALLTFGEGWHNNHHRYAGTARQGFYWWELDATWWLLRAMSAVGIIRDLKGVPDRIRQEGRAKRRGRADG